jgi:hypothetical protein
MSRHSTCSRGQRLSAPAAAALCRGPHNVQVQLGEVFKAVVLCDHPEQWPGLLEAVMVQVGAGRAGVGSWRARRGLLAAVL